MNYNKDKDDKTVYDDKELLFGIIFYKRRAAHLVFVLLALRAVNAKT